MDKLFGPYAFSSTANARISEKLEVYFQEFDLLPLFVQVCSNTFVVLDAHVKSGVGELSQAQVRTYDQPEREGGRLQEN